MSLAALTRRAAKVCCPQSSLATVAREGRRCYSRRTGTEQAVLDAAFERLVQHHRKALSSGSDDGLDALSAARREWQWVTDEVRERRQASLLTREQEGETVSQMIRRLVDDDEPMAYVLGHQPFGPLRIECTPPTLIPRPETEALTEYVVEHIVRAIEKPLRILDLCTGTGCMSLLLRHRLLQLAFGPQATAQTVNASITAVDVASEAIALTKRNAAVYEQSALFCDMGSLVRRQVTFDTRLADVMDDAAMRRLVQHDGPFDVLVCNPPYIPLREWRELDRSVRDWEDRRALVGDVVNDSGDKGDGLDYYHRLAQLIETGGLLRRPSEIGSALPLVAVEVGHDQAIRVAALFTEVGLQNVHVWKDPYGVDRGVLSMPGS